MEKFLRTDELVANARGQTEETAVVQAHLLSALTAIGRAMREEFDPERSLEPFSAELRPLVPHDYLVVHILNEDGKTFSNFSECGTAGVKFHRRHYVPTFHSQERYAVRQWIMGRICLGEAMRVDDFQSDPQFTPENSFALQNREAGLRSGLLVPLASGGRSIGALAAVSRLPGAYSEEHFLLLREAADLIAPFIESFHGHQRERRRRLRLQALEGVTRALTETVNLREDFPRLAEAVRPTLDFDVMGAELLSTTGREAELLAEVGIEGNSEPLLILLDQCSSCNKAEEGKSVSRTAPRRELLPQCDWDHRLIEAGIRSCLIVPLQFGELAGGALYFGIRKPDWYDKFDVEIARRVASRITLAVQQQRIAEGQRRLAEVEGRAQHLEQRLRFAQRELNERYRFAQIIGRAPSLRDALSLARKVAPTETTVLVTGESGTGKELLACAIHHASLRAGRPFVTVSCAALPETLLEAELFGHERGAFTGADRQKAGRFELAAGGTLFLDEVGELSPAVQAKLLRVLQTREFERLGGTKTIEANVRIIAATNRDLEAAVRAGSFRLDLYYRLNVFRIHLPSLRERDNDVLLLADHFVRVLGARMGKAGKGVAKSAREVLLSYPWPGNIRELQNAVERGLILSDGGLLTGAQLGVDAPGKTGAGRPSAAGKSADPPAIAEGSFADVEKRMVREALRKAMGNKTRAAALLGLTRSQLYTRLKRLGLEA